MTLKKGMTDGIPIALGYLSVSFTFGLMAVAGGLEIWQAVLISAANLTSAGQLAGLDIMLAHGGLLEMALAQLIINLRYSLMSIAIAQKADESMTTRARLGIGFGITDEIFALAVGRHETLCKSYMTGLIITPFLGWTLGTLAGAVLGSILPGFVVDALGIALYAMFLAIIIPPARRDIRVAAVIFIAAALSCLRFYTPLRGIISSGFTVIIASVVASALGALIFSREGE
ncbi:MAG: AzlC family ABC transporter permease [Clostridia bacterium]|nr:AzlC family ABC transporter permease [Clostridia bacterium]